VSQSLRKLALTAHVATSVGWLGAVAAVLALAIVGLAGTEAETVRSAYVAMELIGWTALLPLSLASLASGLLQALGTSWGLFRHYWVATKLVMNLLAIAVLVMYMQTLNSLADLARDTTNSLTELRSPSPVVHSVGALLLFVIATVLAIYKPPGRTRYGERKRREALPDRR